jgi:hypothetical protein
VILKTLFGNSRRSAIPAGRLPTLHSFVEVWVGGRSMRRVPVEELSGERITVREALGKVGERGHFVYENVNGKFRFSSAIIQVRDGFTHFAMPQRIETIGSVEAQKRSSLRLETIVPGLWRMAPGGQGVGEFMKGTIRDISRGGCAITTQRQCRVGQWLEIKAALGEGSAETALLGEIVRIDPIPASGKFSHALHFHGLTAQNERTIVEFINRKQAVLRSRGLA